jgi:hypothetical protein
MAANERFFRYGCKVPFTEPGQDSLRKPDGSGTWTIFGESLDSYLDDFSKVDQDGLLPGFLRELALKDKPVILDLLSPTDALVDFVMRHRDGRPIKGLAVGYEENRTKARQDSDAALGISYLGTDLRNFRNFDEIFTQLGNGPIDWVLERGYGGLCYMPTNARYQNLAVQQAWRRLNPKGGLALIQLPPIGDLRVHDIPIENWVDQLGSLDIYHQYLPAYVSKDRSREYGYHQYGLLMLRKDAESQRLPKIQVAQTPDPISVARRRFMHLLDLPEFPRLSPSDAEGM